MKVSKKVQVIARQGQASMDVLKLKVIVFQRESSLPFIRNETQMHIRFNRIQELLARRDQPKALRQLAPHLSDHVYVDDKRDPLVLNHRLPRDLGRDVWVPIPVAANPGPLRQKTRDAQAMAVL